MTEEHIPPRASGNSGSTTLYREDGDVDTVLREFSEGHSVRTLCLECNNGASQRGLPQAYTAWRADVVGHLQTAAAAFHQVTGRPHTDIWGAEWEAGGPIVLPLEHGRGASEKFNNLHPGRIVRQLLGMILAVQAERKLATDYPILADAYFEEGPASIGPLSLHVGLADIGIGYASEGMLSGSIDLTRPVRKTEVRVPGVLSISPFVVLLVVGTDSPVKSTTRIDHWLRYPVDKTFSKGDRTVDYPILDQRELFVRYMYERSERLPR